MMKKTFLILTVFYSILFLISCQTDQPFEHLDAQISVEGPIEISIDKKNWKKVLNDSDFDQYLSKAYPSFEFIPVTTPTGVPPFYSVTENSIEETTVGYLEIPIYIRSDDVAVVQWKSASLSSVPILWTSDADFRSAASEVLTGSEIYSTISNAIRVSLSGKIYDDSHIVVYERSQGYHHNHMLGNGGNLLDDDHGLSGFLSYYNSRNQSMLYGANDVTVAPSITDIREQNNIYLSTLNEMSHQNKIQTTITLRIWVERWDPDSYPAILNQDFSLSLVFIGKRSVNS